MAEVNANSLPAKTDLGSNDSAIVVDQTTNAGALVDLDVLADKVLDRITSKTFANQVGGSSAATLLAQLSTLNSNINNISTQTDGTFSSEYFSAEILWFLVGKTCYITFSGNVLKSEAGSFSIEYPSAIPLSAVTVNYDTNPAGVATSGGLRCQVSRNTRMLYFYKYGTANPLGTRLTVVFSVF